MKKSGVIPIVILGTVATFSLIAGRTASADSTQYTATRTYTSGTSTSAYSAPNKTLTFNFTEPSIGNSLSTSVPVSLMLGSSTVYSGLADIVFYPASQLGLFDLDFTTGGDTFTWEFFGPQMYSGNGPYTISSGTFPIDGPGSSLSQFSDSKGHYSGNFTGGNVTVTSTPEPSSLLLLGFGLMAVGIFARRRLQPAKISD
jgi:hypothetical protein